MLGNNYSWIVLIYDEETLLACQKILPINLQGTLSPPSPPSPPRTNTNREFVVFYLF